MNANGYSIKGRKSRQEDAFYVSQPTSQGQLVLVADGIGGHRHGEFASQCCISLFAHAFEAGESIEAIPLFLKETAQEVAERIYLHGEQNPDYKDCGTTLTGFLVRDDHYFWINIGDSRVYAYDHREIVQQLTKDHSLVQLQLDAGLLLPEDVRYHPQRHQMYSALGLPPDQVKMGVAGPLPLHDRDMLLAFSDGVHDALTDEEISNFLRSYKDDPHFCRKLVETAFDAGGTDNITACCYRHVRTEK